MKTLVQGIEKREDVSPKEGPSKYGEDTPFADEKNKRYALGNEKQVRAAWSYIHMPKNRKFYSAEDLKTMEGKIKRAGKKYGIEFSDDDDDDKDKAESALVYGAAPINLDGQTPESIMFMPRGDWKITPVVRGKATVVSVKVDKTVAATLQESLNQRLDDTIRPYAGFDHQPGPASFIPKEFRWDPERGVMLDVDWTKPGEDAVKGRGHSYFSPTFLLNEKGEVAGLPPTGEIGSLTNNPAFRRIQKIAASADDDDQTGDPIVNAVSERLVELEVITAEQADDESIVVKAITDMHATIGETQAANARLVTENTALQVKVADVVKAEATSIIEAAIAEGKIGAKDQASIDFWTGQLIASPTTAKKVLAAMPANPLLQRVIDVKVRDGKRAAQGQSAADLIEAQHRAVRMVKEKHPGLGHTDAFNRAREEFPEAFPVEA
jgi:hypothetical protein